MGSVMSPYVRVVAAGLRYWRPHARKLSERVDDALEDALDTLEPERTNLFKALDDGLALEATANDAAQLTNALYPLALHRGPWAAWRDRFERGTRVATDPALRAQLMTRCGTLYRFLNDHRQAIVWHERALAEAQQAELLALRGVAHAHLAEEWQKLGDADKAKRLAQVALDVAAQVSAETTSTTAVSHNVLGNVYNFRGDYALAIHHFKRAIKHWEELGHRLSVALNWSNLGNAYARDGRYEDADESFDMALTLLDGTKNVLQKARTRVNLSARYIEDGRFADAERVLKGVYSAELRQIGDLSVLGRYNHNMGMAFAGQNQPQQALIYFDNALAIWQSLSDEKNIGNTLLDKAKALAQIKALDDALRHINDAIARLNPHTAEAWVRDNLVDALAARQRIESALTQR